VPQGSSDAVGGKHLAFWLFSHSASVAVRIRWRGRVIPAANPCARFPEGEISPSLAPATLTNFAFKRTPEICDSAVLLVEKPFGIDLAEE
jgi:hypothetical protein